VSRFLINYRYFVIVLVTFCLIKYYRFDVITIYFSKVSINQIKYIMTWHTARRFLPLRAVTDGQSVGIEEIFK
jgi:hypothetical protein